MKSFFFFIKIELKQSTKENDKKEVCQSLIVNEYKDECNVNIMEDVQYENINEDSLFPLNIDDLENLDKINQNMRGFLVEKDSTRLNDILFLKDSLGRHFDDLHYK